MSDGSVRCGQRVIDLQRTIQEYFDCRGSRRSIALGSNVVRGCNWNNYGRQGDKTSVVDLQIQKTRCRRIRTYSHKQCV